MTKAVPDPKQMIRSASQSVRKRKSKVQTNDLENMITIAQSELHYKIHSF